MIAVAKKLHHNTKDEAGNRYGNLTVIQAAGTHRNGQTQWLCDCGCGGKGIIPGHLLRSGRARSCGCRNKVKDEVGNNYGRLKVLEFVGKDKHRNAQWLCLCDCGKEKVVLGVFLRSGTTTSCGCKRGRMPDNEFALNRVVNSIKQGACGRGLEFRLTKEQVRDIVTQPCHYCGSPPQVRKVNGGRGSFASNGIDRVDNDKGYVENNVVPCCKHCNKAKLDRSYEAFRAWAYQLNKHLIEGNTQ